MSGGVRGKRLRNTRDHLRGCLLGGAIGDALGAPVEFDSLAEIRERFGPEGITDLEVEYGRRGAITDDTQMTLFTAEGLLRANNRHLSRGNASVEAAVHLAYRRWYHTQVPAHGRDAEPPFELRWPGWLIGVRALHARRAPGKTCMDALSAEGWPGEDGARNRSKGCGGVMRVAPVGLVADRAFDLGVSVAGLTHGHPTGRLAAGYLADLIQRLVRGSKLAEAAQASLVEVERHEGHGETSRAVRKAIALAEEGCPGPANVESLGGGWIAEEALAIGLYAALAARDFRHGVLLAVNHSGDSDSTGSIAGQLLGLLCGARRLPSAWRRDVELSDVVTTVADDLWRHLVRGWKDGAPRELERYPAC